MVTVGRAPVQDASLFAQLEQAPDTKQFVLPYSETEHARNILNSSFVYLRILDAGELVGFFILVLDSEPNSVEFRRAVVSDKGKGVGSRQSLQWSNSVGLSCSELAFGWMSLSTTTADATSMKS